MQELEREVEQDIQIIKPRVNEVIKKSQSPIYMQRAEEVKKKADEIEQEELTKMQNNYQPQNKKKLHPHFNRGDMLYIFMSSSVPRIVWDTYAQAIAKTGLSNNIVMVLRGCIGGCTYVMPTVRFLRSVLTDNGRVPKGYDAQIWIDPLLFERFNIQRVPCFVFVRGQDLKYPNLSAGLSYNIVSPGKAYEVCGAWSFYHNVAVLQRMSHSESLKSILPSIFK